MKLYHARSACSLADLIALLDVGRNVEVEMVDIHTKRTRSGADFRDINPKGYVPMLVLDDGRTITENVAVLDWIAEQYPALRPSGDLGRTRQLEMLVFISTEIHRAYKPLWHEATEPEKQKARETVAKLFEFTTTQLHGDYLFGNEIGVADCYLFVMLLWADRFDIAVPDALRRLKHRMEERPSVQAALRREKVSPSVTENAAQLRFERPIRDHAIAAAYYRDEGGRLAFIHTEVPTEFAGAGIGTELARGTFELLLASGRKAILHCPFMVHFYTTHPEYADIVDP